MKRYWPILVVAACVTLRAPAQSVSRSAPPIYTTRLAERLTPLRAARALAKKHGPPPDFKGRVVLDERIHYLADDGKYYVLRHYVFEALTEEAVEDLARDTYDFRKGTQKIHLLRARSIQADGTAQEVAQNAAFIQTPQREADISLYSDSAELVVLYPNVKPGTLTEAIVLTEEDAFRIPGHFTARLPFAFYWPRVWLRHVVELPDEQALRLRMIRLGTGVPEPRERHVRPGRTRYTWEKQDIPRLRWEPNVAPTRQIGPHMRLTTLSDWEDLNGWYQGLLSGRHEISAGLKRQVDAWTAEADGPDAILAALLRKVAREVRYTGIEFGISSFQPGKPDEVWRRQYGDCKDKANLLRAMLRHKNIRAHLALLNTDHAGLIDRRVPDYRDFDHMILAVRTADDRLVFCDPTVPYLPPGSLGPSSAGRDAVLLDEQGVAIVRTPVQEAGTLTYDLDLRMEPNGEIAGWLRSRADGAFGAFRRQTYTSADTETVRERVHDMVCDFFPGADVIDIERHTNEQREVDFRIGAYFIVPPGNNASDDRRHVRFPCWDCWPNLRGYKERRSDYYQWRKTYVVNSRFKLPDGWRAVDLPRPYRVSAAPLSIDAVWSTGPASFASSLEYRCATNTVTAADYPVFYQAIASFQAWLAQPLGIVHAPGVAQEEPLAETALSEFPLMPSGEGQMELLDRRFPTDGDPDERRAALQRVLQWFPDDPQTVFTASIWLADLDSDQGKHKPAIREMRRLLRVYRGSVTHERRAWGEYLLGLAFRAAGRRRDAEKVFTRLARNRELSEFRRGWASYFAALTARKRSDLRARALLGAGIKIDSPALPQQYSLLIELLLESEDPRPLDRPLAWLAETHPDRVAEVLTKLIEDIDSYVQDGHADRAERLAAALEQAIAGRTDRAQLNARLTEAKTGITLVTACRTIAARLKERMRKDMPEWLRRIEIPAKLVTREQLLQACKACKAAQTREWVRYAIHILSTFPPDPQDFPFRLWRVAWNLEHRGLDNELLSFVCELAQSLPRTNRYYSKIQLVRAAALRAADAPDRALDVLEKIAALPDTHREARVSACMAIGEIHEERGEYRRALDSYRRTERDRERSYTADDCCVRGVRLCLELGDRDEAVRLLKPLLSLGKNEFSELQEAPWAEELAALVRDPAAANAYWDRQQRWLPVWSALASKADLTNAPAAIAADRVNDLDRFDQQLGRLREAKDLRGALMLYRDLVLSARWLPSRVVRVAERAPQLADAYPEYARDLRNLVIAMNREFSAPAETLVKQSRMHLIANYIDANRAGNAFDAVHAYRSKYGLLDDRTGQTVARLWGHAAVQFKRERRQAAALLAALLKTRKAVTFRGKAVVMLDALYAALNETTARVRLLERELAHPDIRDDQAVRDRLKACLRRLHEEGARIAKFDEAVARWLHRHKPGWYAYAEPHSLADPRLADLQAVRAKPRGVFAPAEAFKLNMLVATAPSQPHALRRTAFVDAVRGLARLRFRKAEAYALYQTALEDEALDGALRARLLWHALYLAYANSDRERFQSLAECPLKNELGERSRQHVDKMRATLETDLLSTGQVAAYLRRKIRSSLDTIEVANLCHLYPRLLNAGAFPAAHDLIEALRSVTFDRKATRTKAELQLQLMRDLNRAERMWPAHMALRQLVFERFSPATITKPPGYDTLFGHHTQRHLPAHDLETARNLLLFDLKSNRVPPYSTGFWRDLLWTLAADTKETDLLFALLQKALQTWPDDRTKSLVTTRLMWFVDFDVPRQVQQLAEISQPYRDPQQYPQTYAGIRLHELRIAVRFGPTPDLETATAHLRNPEVVPTLNRLRLQHYLQQKDTARLRRVLDAMAPDAYIECSNIPFVLPALELLGRREEAKLVEKEAQRSLYRAILDSWMSLEIRPFYLVFSLASALEGQVRFPDAWLTHCRASVRMRRLAVGIELRDAVLRKDWERALSLSAARIREHPPSYAMYWQKGRALYELGRMREARKALGVFTRFRRDTLEYPEAMRMLKQTESSAPRDSDAQRQK